MPAFGQLTRPLVPSAAVVHFHSSWLSVSLVWVCPCKVHPPVGPLAFTPTLRFFAVCPLVATVFFADVRTLCPVPSALSARHYRSSASLTPSRLLRVFALWYVLEASFGTLGLGLPSPCGCVQRYFPFHYLGSPFLGLPCRPFPPLVCIGTLASRTSRFGSWAYSLLQVSPMGPFCSRNDALYWSHDTGVDCVAHLRPLACRITIGLASPDLLVGFWFPSTLDTPTTGLTRFSGQH